MSLIICKNINNRIFIESDSRITDINAARKESYFGILKTIILHPRVSICFAGNIYFAEKSSKEIFLQKKLTTDHLIETLHNYHKDNNDSMEFILCIIFDNATREIIKISNFSVDRNLSNAWIGDLSGFRFFQTEYHKLREKGNSNKEAFKKAFASVIDNHEITTVGDFRISAHTISSTTGNLMFLYTERIGIYLYEPQSLKSTTKKQSINVTRGTPEGGSFEISNFVSVLPNHYSVGLYFTHGNFDILFCPKLSFGGILISKVSNLEFLEIINSQYNIPLSGFRMVENAAMQIVDMRFSIKPPQN